MAFGANAQVRGLGRLQGNVTDKNTGKPIAGNEPTDANMTADSGFQQEWVRHLVSRWGTAARGGLKYYLLDNEPSIWFQTHRDVHPTPVSDDESRAIVGTPGAAVSTVMVRVVSIRLPARSSSSSFRL